MGPATDKHQAPTHRLKLYVRAVIESSHLSYMFLQVSPGTVRIVISLAVLSSIHVKGYYQG